jgi:hypothetical protein
MGAYKLNTKEDLIAVPDFEAEVAPGKRRRSKKRGPLLLKEKIEILEKIHVSFETHKEVAREYRVSANVVAHLASKAKKNPEVLSELHSRHQAKLEKEWAISKIVCDLNDRNVIIDRASQVSTLAE